MPNKVVLTKMSVALHRIQESSESSRTPRDTMIYFGGFNAPQCLQTHQSGSLFVVPSYFVVESFNRGRFQMYNIKPNEVLDHSLFIQMSYLTVTAQTMKCIFSI